MTLPAAFLTRPLAHRGLHDAVVDRIENSRSSFRAAIAAGYGIELDVQLSRDDRAMVFHDDRLDRLTDLTGPVRDRTASDLRKVALGGGDCIESLDTILPDIAGRVPVLIEMKDPTGGLGPTGGELEQAVADALAQYDGPAAAMSFNPHMVAELGRHAPSVSRGLTTCRFDAAGWDLPEETRIRLRGIPDYDRSGACFISHDWRDLNTPRVVELKRSGAAVLCWTIRSPEDAAAARRLAHNITFEACRPA